MVEFALREQWSLNSSEMGTGKTRAAIESVLQTSAGATAIVVCPAFLVATWEDEILKWAAAQRDRFTIVAYTRLSKDPFCLNGSTWVILDEAHYIGNPEAKRTIEVMTQLLIFRPQRLLMLTGTPIQNRVPELWTLLSVLDMHHDRGFSSIFPTIWSFGNFFCYVKKKKFGGRTTTSFFGLKKPEVLLDWLNPVAVQVTTEEAGDMPDLVFESVVCPVDDPDLDRWLEDAWGEKVELVHVSSRKVRNGELKAATTIATVQHLVATGQGPVVVFSDHTVPARKIFDGLRCRKVLVTGETTKPAERQAIAAQFQGGKFDVLVATIGAMSTGVTLTAAYITVFNDFSWKPGENKQAIYRIYRLGQTRSCRVLVVARRGVDQQIVDQLTSKMETISVIRGGLE
jgi:hypothetical protein